MFRFGFCPEVAWGGVQPGPVGRGEIRERRTRDALAARSGQQLGAFFSLVVATADVGMYAGQQHLLVLRGDTGEREMLTVLVTRSQLQHLAGDPDGQPQLRLFVTASAADRRYRIE